MGVWWLSPASVPMHSDRLKLLDRRVERWEESLTLVVREGPVGAHRRLNFHPLVGGVGHRGGAPSRRDLVEQVGPGGERVSGWRGRVGDGRSGRRRQPARHSCRRRHLRLVAMAVPERCKSSSRPEDGGSSFEAGRRVDPVPGLRGAHQIEDPVGGCPSFECGDIHRDSATNRDGCHALVRFDTHDVAAPRAQLEITDEHVAEAEDNQGTPIGLWRPAPEYRDRTDTPTPAGEAGQISIEVRNRSEAVAFYSELLRWTFDEPFPDYPHAREAGVSFGIRQSTNSPSTGIAWRVANVEAMAARARALGAEVEPITTFAAGSGTECRSGRKHLLPVAGRTRSLRSQRDAPDSAIHYTHIAPEWATRTRE